MEESAHYLEFPRVPWWAGALTIAAAVTGVLAVREVPVRILHPDPAFTPLSLGSSIVATIVCTTMAIYIFVGMVSYPESDPQVASGFCCGRGPVDLRRASY